MHHPAAPRLLSCFITTINPYVTANTHGFTTPHYTQAPILHPTAISLIASTHAVVVNEIQDHDCQEFQARKV